MTQDKDEDKEKLEGEYNVGEPSPSDPRENRLASYPLCRQDSIDMIKQIMKESDGFEDFLTTLGKRSYGVSYSCTNLPSQPDELITLYSDELGGPEELEGHKRYAVNYDTNEVHHQRTLYDEMPPDATQYNF